MPSSGGAVDALVGDDRAVPVEAQELEHAISTACLEHEAPGAVVDTDLRAGVPAAETDDLSGLGKGELLLHG